MPDRCNDSDQRSHRSEVQTSSHLRLEPVEVAYIEAVEVLDAFHGAFDVAVAAVADLFGNLDGMENSVDLAEAHFEEASAAVDRNDVAADAPGAAEEGKIAAAAAAAVVVAHDEVVEVAAGRH